MVERSPLQLAGERLAEVRQLAGLSVGQAARLLALPGSSLKAWEAGEAQPDELTAKRLELLYDAPVRDVLRPDWTPLPLPPDLARALARSRASAEDKARIQRLFELTGRRR